MRVPSTSPLAVTYALSDPGLAEQALAALVDRSDPIAVDGLLDFLDTATNARHVITAIDLLSEIAHPAVDVSLVRLLRSRWPSVQGGAVAALTRRGFVADPWCHEELVRLLVEHTSWTLRRNVLQSLASSRDPRLLVAASDPHWRVRHAFVQLCLARSSEETLAILEKLQPVKNVLVQGVVQYLQRHWGMEHADEKCARQQRPPIWDDDPAVLERLLVDESRRCDAATWAWLPQLAQHDVECVHRRACQLLLEVGNAQQLAATANALHESRHAAFQALVELFARIDRFRCAEVVAIIFSDEHAAPGAVGWAIENSRQVPGKFNRDDHAFIRRALARHALQRDAAFNIDQQLKLVHDEDAEVRFLAATSLMNRNAILTEWWSAGLHDICPAIRAISVTAAAKCGQTEMLSSLAGDPWPEVRMALAAARIVRESLGSDHHPAVRAAALTAESAAAAIANPEQENSWRVLAAACRMQRLPVCEIAPVPEWRPPKRTVTEQPNFVLSVPRMPAQMRLLGSAKTPVSALAISGHYQLPSAGFATAVDRGVNLFFWEPNYDTLTKFSRGISPGERQQLHFIAGTFEATPSAIRRDAERALRVLHLDRLELFLLFWTRSWQRLDDAVYRELDDLRQSGSVRMIGLSTHNRALALEAVDASWNPVMVRHSAAHRGAEEAIFPAAITKGTSLLAFNSTCYGRLLSPLADGTRVSASDCYRYTLSHPAVTSCLCAPSTLPQLNENLEVLENLQLAHEALVDLRKVGDHVYQEDVAFRKTLR